MNTAATEPNAKTKEAIEALKNLAEMPGNNRWDYL